MPSTCGQIATNLWIHAGKMCDRMSTFQQNLAFAAYYMCVEPRVLPKIIISFPTQLSTYLNYVLPLSEYIFYPESTPPITNTTI